MNPHDSQIHFRVWVPASIGRQFDTAGESAVDRPSVADDHIDERLEELNRGAPTAPRSAAGVILMRHGGKHSSSGLEVLLGRRTSRARFMADVWVFPGGAVDGSADDDRAHRATAL